VPAWKGTAPPRAPSPEWLAFDGRGDLHVADTANSRVLVLSPSGRWLGSRDLRREFVGPIGGIAFDPNGALLVADYDGNHILRLSDSGHVLARWGANPSGPALTNPQGMGVDQAGNSYVADQGNGRILEYSAAGRLRAVWPIAATGVNGPYLYGVAVDRQDTVYTTDQLNGRVLKLSSSGRVVARWGAAGSGPGQMRAPEGLAVDNRTGTVYVADTDNRRIQVFSVTGKYLGSSSARFVRPVDVAVDSRGSVYVADAGSRRIEKFSR
jgi:DNA-binding beta-propeller fold protein YncE